MAVYANDNRFGYEIDFFPVGNGKRSGDAIVVRFGYLHNGTPDEKFTVIIDGGFNDVGDVIVKHLTNVAGSEVVNLMISTHPDGDHVGGLIRVMESIPVNNLWMHRPWLHTNGIADLFHDGRVTDNSVAERLREALNGAKDLEELAEELNVTIVEPFTGLTEFGQALTVLSPTEVYYESLLPNFRSTPEPVKQTLMKRAAGVARRVLEEWDVETLSQHGDTSAENESSVVTLFTFGDRRILLTGDAGIGALTHAADRLDTLGVSGRPTFIQVPHHGSRHNVTPGLLDRIVGKRLTSDVRKSTAFVSASPEDPDHPSRQVTNAFRRRGAPVCRTSGNQICHSHNAPDRAGWVPISPLPFFDEVEE